MHFPGISWNNLSTADWPPVRGEGSTSAFRRRCLLFQVCSVLMGTWGLNTRAHVPAHVAAGGIIPMNVDEWPGTMNSSEWAVVREPFMRPEWQVNSQGGASGNTDYIQKTREDLSAWQNQAAGEAESFQLARWLGRWKQEEAQPYCVTPLRTGLVLPKKGWIQEASMTTDSLVKPGVSWGGQCLREPVFWPQEMLWGSFISFLS